ncbi:MAG: transposase, partial [Candidatus Subteraquimicrobiales bacterium]|nr:transposase [Candidatus Subteraquimicrobiales bacterium]
DVFNRIIDIPGFSDKSALLLLSEIGFDLSTFPSHKNFCSWAGLAPGKKESAGVNKSGRIYVRQHYLKALLVEVAFAASKCKDTYYNAKFHSLKFRISTQKAVVAIARKLAIAIFMIIKEGKIYCELTPDYIPIERQAKDLKFLERLSKRMEKDAIVAYLNMITETK